MHFKDSLIGLFTSGDSRSKVVKANSFYSILIKGASVLISFLLVPMTIGYVSTELYGIWLTLSSIIHWMNYLDVGFSLGLKNKLVEAIANKDYSKARSYVSTTYGLMFLIFIPLGVILSVITPYIDWANLLKVNLQYNGIIVNAVQIMIAFFSLQMIVHVITAVVSAYQKVALSSLFGVIGQFISLVIIFVLTKTTPSSLILLCIVFSGAPLLSLIISSIIMYSGEMHEVKPSLSSVNFSLVKDLWTLGWKFFVIQIQLVLVYQMTNILISYISGPEAVTQYNVAYKYLSIGYMVMMILVAPLWPAFSDAYVKKDFSWMNKVYKKFLRLFAILFVCQVVLVLFSNIFYYFWVGEDVIIPVSLSILVSVYLLAYTFVSLHTYMLNGIGFLNIQVYMFLIGGMIHIPLSLLLGRYLGFAAVIISLTFIHLIYCFVVRRQLVLLLTNKAIGIWSK